jgi:hypothetical protein
MDIFKFTFDEFMICLPHVFRCRPPCIISLHAELFVSLQQPCIPYILVQHYKTSLYTN